ncbi:transposable element Tc1 transposase [Trichonephila clavipes]|nr:transposable element Tc1 transposase [Trichonephila clavipes]
MPGHCRVRLQWCLAQSGWNHAYWGCIVFSDESCFQLCPDDRRRRPWQCADPASTIVRHTGPQPGMLCDPISFDRQTLLVVIRGTLTAQQYINAIPRTVLLPFLLQYPRLIFRQDNSTRHTAHIAMNCPTACQTLPWLARSLSN